MQYMIYLIIKELFSWSKKFYKMLKVNGWKVSSAELRFINVARLQQVNCLGNVFKKFCFIYETTKRKNPVNDHFIFKWKPLLKFEVVKGSLNSVTILPNKHFYVYFSRFWKNFQSINFVKHIVMTCFVIFNFLFPFV